MPHFVTGVLSIRYSSRFRVSLVAYRYFAFSGKLLESAALKFRVENGKQQEKKAIGY
jgi:hypothetical protein